MAFIIRELLCPKALTDAESHSPRRIRSPLAKFIEATVEFGPIGNA